MATKQCPKCGDLVLHDSYTDWPHCIKHGDFFDAAVKENRRYLAELSKHPEAGQGSEGGDSS